MKLFEEQIKNSIVCVIHRQNCSLSSDFAPVWNEFGLPLSRSAQKGKSLVFQKRQVLMRNGECSSCAHDNIKV